MVGLDSSYTVGRVGRLTGWQLGVVGASELGETTTLATTSTRPSPAESYLPSIRRGRQHELDRIEAGVASLTLINQDGAFNAANTVERVLPDIRPMIPLRIRATFAGSIPLDDRPRLPL